MACLRWTKCERAFIFITVFFLGGGGGGGVGRGGGGEKLKKNTYFHDRFKGREKLKYIHDCCFGRENEENFIFTTVFFGRDNKELFFHDFWGWREHLKNTFYIHVHFLGERK